MEKTHWKKTMNPNYLGAYALEPNQDLVVTITDVKTEQVMNADGRNEECLVAHLKDHKPLIVNKTNAKAIAKVADLITSKIGRVRTYPYILQT